MCYSVNGEFHLSCPVALAEALVTQSRALPRHHCLVSRTVRHPYPPVLVRTGAALWEETHTLKPAAASRSIKLMCLTLPCCRRHSLGPFFSYHRDVAMTSTGRSLVLEKTPGMVRASVTPLPPLPAQDLSLTRTSDAYWHSQGPRLP